jgi:hypothetical protein
MRGQERRGRQRFRRLLSISGCCRDMQMVDCYLRLPTPC